jgi:hypothetical protein
MRAEPNVSAKIGAYLAELKPATRAALFVGIERARLAGEAEPVHEFLESILRTVASGLGETPPRVPTPRRLFLDPVEPFLTDIPPQSKVTGRVPRPMLQPIWTWISRDVAAAEVRALALDLTAHLGSRSTTAELDEIAGALAGSFRAAVLDRLSPRLAEARADADVARKIGALLGGPRGIDELEDLLAIVRNRPALDRLLAGVPDPFDLDDPEHVAAVVAALGGAATGGRVFAAHASALLHARAPEPVRLVELATETASTDVRVLAGSPFGPLLELLLADIEAKADAAIDGLAAEGGDPAARLREYNAAARLFRSTLDLDKQSSDWGRRLREARTRLSEKLARELADLPALLRACLRPARAKGAPPSGPDPIDVARACRLIALFDAAKLAAGELALHETVVRLNADIETYVDGATAVIAEELRRAPAEARPVGTAAAAVRIQEALHGPGAAAVLRRSFEVAGSTSLAPLLAAAG